MRPVLFELGGIPIYSHGFFLTLGLLVCLAVLIYEARRRRWAAHEVVPITLAAFVDGVLGARLAMLFFQGCDVATIGAGLSATCRCYAVVARTLCFAPLMTEAARTQGNASGPWNRVSRDAEPTGRLEVPTGDLRIRRTSCR